MWGEAIIVCTPEYVEAGQPSTPDEAAQAAPESPGEARLEVGFLNKAGTLLLSAHINAVETPDDARTISAPRLMAANAQEVSIKSLLMMHSCHGGSSRTTEANIQFRDEAIDLKITPHIEEGGKIIALNVEVTAEGGPSPAEDYHVAMPRQAKARAMVKDRETIVIGRSLIGGQPADSGQTQESILLQELLRPYKRPTGPRTELLILITPTIIPIDI